MAAILANLPALTANQTIPILMNWGVNDVAAMPAEATWKANYLAIIDAVTAKWPSGQIYITRPWKRGFTAECNILAGWITDIVAARSNTHVGPDERIWLEHGDDGVGYTSDGVHYNTAGNLVAAEQWRAILWP